MERGEPGEGGLQRELLVFLEWPSICASGIAPKNKCVLLPVVRSRQCLFLFLDSFGFRLLR